MFFFYHCSLQSNSKGKLSKPLIRGQWDFFLPDFPNILMKKIRLIIEDEETERIF